MTRRLKPLACCQRIGTAVGDGGHPVRSAPDQEPNDVFDIGAADANRAQLMIRDLKPFARRLSVPSQALIFFEIF